MFAKKHLTSSLLAFHFVFCRSVCVCECLSECKRNEIRFALVLFRQKIIELRGPVSLCVRSFLVATLRIRGARFSPVSVVGLVWAGGSRPKWALNVVCAVSGAAGGSVSLGPSEEWRGRGESCPHAEGYPPGTGGGVGLRAAASSSVGLHELRVPGVVANHACFAFPILPLSLFSLSGSFRPTSRLGVASWLSGVGLVPRLGSWRDRVVSGRGCGGGGGVDRSPRDTFLVFLRAEGTVWAPGGYGAG